MPIDLFAGRNRFAPESFSPVLNQDFLNSLFGNINAQEEQDIGSAQSQAVQRGLTGDPFEAAAVGGARSRANTARNSALSDFLFRLAGMRENENVLAERQGFERSERKDTEAFNSAESDKDRLLKLMIQENEGSQENTRARRKLQGDIAGEGFKLGEQGLGIGLGSFF